MTVITRGRKRRSNPRDDGRSDHLVHATHTKRNKSQETSNASPPRSLRSAARNAQLHGVLTPDPPSPASAVMSRRITRQSSTVATEDAPKSQGASNVKKQLLVKPKVVTRESARLAALHHPPSPPSPALLPAPSSTSSPEPASPPPTPSKAPVQRLRLTVKPDTPPPIAPKKSTKGYTKNHASRVGEPNTETDDDAVETFGHKLTRAQADTTRGTPGARDKELFARAKAVAAQSMARSQSASSAGGSPLSSDNASGEAANGQLWGNALELPKIHQIRFGDCYIDTWYIAPYPEEYSQYPVLYICEYCLKYMKSAFVAGRHKIKCPTKHPPGDEIYRDGKISIFEVDGRKNKIYCQNLCLLAKMFLDHKTLYYDVEPFLFYIMTEVDDDGCHFVGYFSKEKRSAMNYNVSCILTLPIHQRKGYGQFLIDFSYLLTKKENKTGSPEKPLSDLGLLSYRSYWKNTVFRQLQHQAEPISIDELSLRTSMTPDDIISTLQTNDMIQFDAENNHILCIDQSVIDAHLRYVDSRHHLHIDPSKLTWTPFVLSRDRLAILMGQQRTIKNQEENADVDVTGDEATDQDGEG